jgi:hypothetical protein
MRREMEEKKGKYDDIINLPHHVSQTRQRMSMIDRAAQFSPFAALVGYEDAVEETARLTDDKIELTEESKTSISEKLRFVSENIESNIKVKITYFVPDKKKSGGAYATFVGSLRYIDEYERTVVMTDKTVIQIDQIWNVEII